MKKIFTLLLAAVATLSMAAADLQFQFGADHANVASGSTIQVGYELNDLGFMKQYKWDSQLFLFGEYGLEVGMHVTATDAVQFCGIDGNCQNGTDLSKEGALGMFFAEDVDDDNTRAELQIDKTLSEAPSQDITVEVTAWDLETPDNKITVKVIFVAKPASEVNNGGIAATKVEGDFVKAVAGNSLAYNVSAPRTLSLYAITGNLVARYPIANSGVLNLGSLSRGIYLYTDGKHSGKILVK